MPNSFPTWPTTLLIAVEYFNEILDDKEERSVASAHVPEVTYNDEVHFALAVHMSVTVQN